MRRIKGLTLALLLSNVPAALAQDGTLVVLNKSEATASLIDLVTGEVAATVPTGAGPHEAAVSPDGRLAVATNYGTGPEPGSTLTVIDIPGARVVRTIDLGEYRRPHGIVFLADGRRLVVTAEGNQAVLTVDVTDGNVTGAVKTGQEVSHMVAVTPDGGRAFVANIGSGSISVVDLKKGELVRNIATGDGAEGIDITPDGRQVWVTNRSADTVTVIDASSLEVMGEMQSKTFPIRAKATPDGRHVLVSNARSGDLSVFNTSTRALSRRVPMALAAGETEGRLFGGNFGSSSVPIGILIPPDGRRAYVANANADVVSIVDLQTWETVGQLKPGREPDGMAWSPLRVRGAESTAPPAAPPQARPGG